MKLYRSADEIWLKTSEDRWHLLPPEPWHDLINRMHLHDHLSRLAAGGSSSHAPELEWLAPIDRQEVWAAGVTYLRSKVARMEEAQEAGGGDFYDRVYDADRPELFFKATAARTVGPEQAVHIRRDSSWNVPEPELTLFCSSAGTIEAYTIGNDVSSRSIEGENPLYLPQAKSYSRSAALGPCLYVPPRPISQDTKISMQILRGDHVMYDDAVSISMMKRTPLELVEYLFRECDFPFGVFLMTGTCLVPSDDFTLEVEDEIQIDIDQIGTLRNRVSRRDLN